MSLIQPIRNFFDFANPQFFSVLGRRNKRFYADCIVELYRYITMMTSFCSQDDAITVLSTVAGKYNGKLEQEDLAAEQKINSHIIPKSSADEQIQKGICYLLYVIVAYDSVHLSAS